MSVTENTLVGHQVLTPCVSSVNNIHTKDTSSTASKMIHVSFVGKTLFSHSIYTTKAILKNL